MLKHTRATHWGSLARQSASSTQLRSVRDTGSLRLRTIVPARRRGPDREVSSGSRVPVFAAITAEPGLLTQSGAQPP